MMNNVAMNICIQLFMWMYALFPWGIYLGVEFLGHMVTINCQTVFQNDCAILHYHQQGMRVAMYPCPP